MEQNKLPGFQQYLVDKGFKRTCAEPFGVNEVENYNSIVLSTYNPVFYSFKKDNLYCYWGLCEHRKPPVMFLGNKKMRVIQNKGEQRTFEDGYRILFSKWHEDKFDLIYDVFTSDNKKFVVNCIDQSIEIINTN